ncbi:MAG: type II and III secretion system protein family protein [Planctomycetaceae bacterium]
MHRGKTLLFVLAAGCLVVPAIGTLRAQQDIEPPSPSETVFQVREDRSTVTLTEQSSKIIEHSARIKSVDGHDSKVIDVKAISPTQIRVHAEASGVTDIVLTDEFGKRYKIEVFVIGDVRHLKKLIRHLYPHSAIDVIEVNGSVILNGWMTQPEEINEVVAIAETFYDTVLNHMKVGGVQQVLLKCQILEVQRTKLRRFGVNFLINGQDANFASNPGTIAPITGGPLTGFSVAGIGESTLTFGLFNQNRAFAGLVQALRDENMLKLQSVPSVVTTNGSPASILSGGEVPIVVPAGLGTVAIEFRSFGIQLDAVPIILGNGRVRLKLRPEVSERDFSSAVTVDGIAVPGFSVRRAETQVEMKFGETLAIGGLISRRETESISKVPLFGELPWLGALFSKKTSDWSESELIILVTPHYAAGMDEAPPGGPGQFSDAPTDKELYFHNMIEIPKYGDDCENCDVNGVGGNSGGCGCASCSAGGVQGGIGCTGQAAPMRATMAPAAMAPNQMNSSIGSPGSVISAPTYQAPSAPVASPPSVIPVAPEPLGGSLNMPVPPAAEQALPGLIEPGSATPR